MHTESILDELINIPILADLSQQELKIVGRYWDFHVLPQSEILFSEGDSADALYYVLAGNLVIYKDTQSAIPLEIARVGPQQFLGELAVLEDSFRSGTVQAATDAELLLLRKTDFYKLIDQYPRIGVILLKGLARIISLQLRNTTGQFVAIHTG